MEEANDLLALPGILNSVKASLEAGQIKEMQRVSIEAVERFPFLMGLAVHCSLMALDFKEAIRLQHQYRLQGTLNPIAMWAMQKDIPNMADVGEAIFMRIRERHAKIANSQFELEGPNTGGDLRDYRLTYIFIMEQTDQAIQLMKELEELHAQFPHWSPDVTVTFTSPELQALQSAAAGTLQ